MKDQSQWRKAVQRIVRSEMSLRGMKYQGLSDRLADIGISQSADNLRNKVNKGILGADLMLQILYVLNARPLSVEMMSEVLNDCANSQ
ncbi:DUF6471 domain-containing protein [Alteromonas gilva]|uniref:DUF6471 domain-containing protein n=1 Tax=Alteromonas gilva TaxID=2987522 RepID=A0ABT5L019_9ALTE|nr:DUF6471 domain-containing protein [Alteromonas gilva]MDC8830369.1 DUF6471 domain-containing protein [Alteromonas gilva]